jgi:hypothetical protein
VTSRRWSDDARGRGVAEAGASLPAIKELAELAATPDWVAEEPETHLLPGLRERIAISGLSLDRAEVNSDGALHVALSSTAQLSRREIRQAVWSILGGAVEMTTHVHETKPNGKVTFDVVTGLPPGDGPFATHGHTLRIEVSQPA